MVTISSKIPRPCQISPEEKKRLLENNQAANLVASKQKALNVKVDQASQSLADSVLKTIPTQQPSKIPRPVQEIYPHADLDLLWDELESKPNFSNCGTKHQSSTESRKLPAGYKRVQYGQGLEWDPQDVKPHKEAKENSAFFQKMSILNLILALSKKYAEPKPPHQGVKEAFENDAINIMKQFQEAKEEEEIKNSLAIVPYKPRLQNENSQKKGVTPNEKTLLITAAAFAAIYFFTGERN